MQFGGYTTKRIIIVTLSMVTLSALAALVLNGRLLAGKVQSTPHFD
jgi:hypothetical protein